MKKDERKFRYAMEMLPAIIIVLAVMFLGGCSQVNDIRWECHENSVNNPNDNKVCGDIKL